jgi:hypothetical protein
LFSTSQLILFVFLPSYLLVLSAGYMIARRNRRHPLTTLGLRPGLLPPLTGSFTDGFKTLLDLIRPLIPLPLLPVLALLSFPYFFIVTRVQQHREAEFTECMRLAGRVISWPEARDRAMANQGTLIHERPYFNGPSRFWWTPDDVAGLSPFPFVRFSNDKRHLFDEKSRPFGNWCRERYTNKVSGSALLVEQPRTKTERRSFPREANDTGYIEFFSGMPA